TCSSLAPIGEHTTSPAFWSQADASQLAATVTGREPPVTKPKYRRPAEATVAGEPSSSSSASTRSGLEARSGSGPSNRASAPSAVELPAIDESPIAIEQKEIRSADGLVGFRHLLRLII